MKFDLSKIKFSNWDKHFKIKIPKKMSLDLAELIGVMVGDGHVGIYSSPDGPWKQYQMEITGNIIDEVHMDFVNGLIQKVFSINFHKNLRKEQNSVVLRKKSKAICLFYREIVDIPNNKNSISVPNCIKISNLSIKAAFIRGLADADFCLTIKYKPNAYPVIQGGFKSQSLTEECSKILNELGIKNYVRKEVQYYQKRDKTYITHRIYINGFKRIKKYMELIGFSNDNKTAKYIQALQERKDSKIKPNQIILKEKILEISEI